MNYHFIGFLKKFLLFLVFISFYNNNDLQMAFCISLLGMISLINLKFRTHRSGVLNFLKSLSDIVSVTYFMMLYLINRKMRDLEGRPVEYLESLTDLEIEEIGKQ